MLPSAPTETPLAILAEGCLGSVSGKATFGLLRYGRWPVAAVIDSSRVGRSLQEICPHDGAAEIVASLDDALASTPRPRALLLGAAPIGGALPASWRAAIVQALEQGLHVVNGLHEFLQEDPELVALARRNRATLWDVRDPTGYPAARGRPIARGDRLRFAEGGGCRVVGTVGTDCGVGKMFTALELDRGARRRGTRSGFLATGQLGILISGAGVPLDRVIGDFMAGAAERALDAVVREENPEWVFVEGQGSLLHPSFSGVTLALLHGTQPDLVVLCHDASRAELDGGYAIPIPPLGRVARMYEEAGRWVRPGAAAGPRVAAVSVNTHGLGDAAARACLDGVRRETGLPATDPVRFGPDAILDALGV